VHALVQKQTKSLSLIFQLIISHLAFISLAAIQHERKKVEETKDTEADIQGGQTRGHQGHGLIQTELQAHRLNPSLLFPSKESIKNSHKKNQCKKM